MSKKEINASPRLSVRHTVGWVLLSVLTAALSISTVLHQTKEASFAQILDTMLEMKHFWLGAAVCCMLGFIFFEACAIRQACNVLNVDCKAGRTIPYAAADIYFSAITPSASGGQPASAGAMIQDGIPAMKATAVLILNLSMYSLSLVLIGLICMITRPGLLSCFGNFGQFLILFGCVVQVGLAFIFILLIRNEKALSLIGTKGIHLLKKLHLIRREEKLLARFTGAMEQYKRCGLLFQERKRKLWKVLVFNFLQRVSQIAVAVCVYIGLGGGRLSAYDLWVLQSMVLIGSNFVPIPGGMGVTDYLMLNGFSSFLTPQQAVNLEMISRTLSFYCCILVCGLILLGRYCMVLYQRKEHTP